jgi:hypothetical protein
LRLGSAGRRFAFSPSSYIADSVVLHVLSSTTILTYCQCKSQESRGHPGLAVAETLAGSASLTFTDPATGTLQFNVDNVSRTKAISRLSF